VSGEQAVIGGLTVLLIMASVALVGWILLRPVDDDDLDDEM
jgi:hypothetical protein